MVGSKKRKVSLGTDATAAEPVKAAKKTKTDGPAGSTAPLSAVAARRAAAAAAAAALEVSQPVEESRAELVEEEAGDSDEDLSSDGEEQASAQILYADKAPANEPQAGPSSPLKTSRPSRYFAAPSAAPASTMRAKKAVLQAKAFSPSMAMVELPAASESEDDEEAAAASDEDNQSLGDSDEEEDEDEDVVVPIVPVVSIGRRARKGKGPEQGTSSGFSSLFEPIEGVNVSRMSQAAVDGLRGFIDFASTSAVSSGVVISLGEGETLAIAGLVQITPLQGAIALESTIIRPTTSSSGYRSHRLFGPTSHPIPVLSGTPSKESILIPSSLNKALRLPSTFQLQDGTKLRTVVLITELECGIEGLGGAVPGFARLWPGGEGAFGVRGFHPIIGSFPQPVYPHVTPESWASALTSLPSETVDDTKGDDKEWDQAAEERREEARSRPFIGMVKGPKRSGKSTFARAMANELLTSYERVAFLECDLGQSEFGCGGVVGLYVTDKPILGPSFTHPALPVRSHFIGAYSPKSSPDHYLDSIHALLEHYRFEVQYDTATFSSTSDKISESIPLVVNTQGWVKGLGMDLLRSIEQMVGPTHVFAFEAAPIEDDADGRQNNPGWTRSPEHDTVQLPGEIAWGVSTNNEPVVYHTLMPAPISPLLTRYTPADLRILSTMAYFHASFTANPTWDFSSSLVAQRPWQIDANEVLKSIVLSGEGSDCILAEDVPLALNGSIVALVDSSADLDTGSALYAQGRSVPPPAESNCLALALIRACNPTLEIQLLTPLPASHLGQVNTIIKGELELPNCAMLDGDEDGVAGVPWESVPFFEAGPVPKGAVGMAKRRFRRNLQRKGM